jgi:predicted nuclease of predicted toxin-antitoxin system
MKKYLVDANLPSKIKVWQTDEFEFVNQINEEWTDSEVWDYAKQNNLTIISKDSDFSHRIIVSDPPPKIIHIKIGNMKLKDFNETIEKLWETAEKISENYKLVNVFIDRIEAVE